MALSDLRGTDCEGAACANTHQKQYVSLLIDLCETTYQQAWTLGPHLIRFPAADQLDVYCLQDRVLLPR